MTPEELLRTTVEAFRPEIERDDEQNGGDMVEWFFGTFIPDACEALGIPTPTIKRDTDPCP